MYIFYFLSVASLLMAGLILSSELLGKKINFFFDFTKFTKTYPLFLLILGIVVLLIGAFKFAISVGNAGIGIPVVGDFFPAVGGVLGGLLLILYYASICHSSRGIDGHPVIEDIDMDFASEFQIGSVDKSVDKGLKAAALRILWHLYPRCWSFPPHDLCVALDE